MWTCTSTGPSSRTSAGSSRDTPRSGNFDSWTLYWRNQIIRIIYSLHCSSYLLRQRVSACFVLKFALQREEGEKREGVQISKQSTKNFDRGNTLSPAELYDYEHCARTINSPEGNITFGRNGGTNDLLPEQPLAKTTWTRSPPPQPSPVNGGWGTERRGWLWQLTGSPRGKGLFQFSATFHNTVWWAFLAWETAKIDEV